MSKQPMQNKHLEHPEDCILTGDLSVLDWFSADSTISVKMDGADMDEMELFDIRNRLQKLMEV